MSDLVTNAKGKSLNLSVSSADTFEDCNVKWLFGYYYRVPQAPKVSTDIGNKVHDALELKLKTGNWPAGMENPRHRIRIMAERALLASGLEVVPGVGVKGGWETEEWTPKGLTCGPLNFKGKVDIHRVAPRSFKAGDKGLQVWDWKTSKNPLASYNPTASSLGYKRQPLAYGYAMGTKYGLEGQPFTTRYIYTSTVDDTAFPLDADEPIPWERAVEEWKRMEVLAFQMADIATRAHGRDPKDFVHEVDKNTRSCRKYGGCDYANVCPFSPVNRVKAEFQPTIDTSTVSKEKLVSNTNNLAALAQLAGVTATPTPAAAITPTAAQPAAPAPAPPSTDPDDVTAALAAQVEAMLAAGPFSSGIPAGVLESMAIGAGASLDGVVAATGITLVDGKYGKPAVAPEPDDVQLTPEVTPGTSLKVVKELEAQGHTLAELLGGNGLVACMGLAVTPGDKAEFEAKGPAGVSWLFEKYPQGPAVAVVTEVINKVEAQAPAIAPAPTSDKKMTATQELDAAVNWLSNVEWVPDGMSLTDVKEAFKKNVLPHRERLGGTFVGKAIDRLNKQAGSALLEVVGETSATKRVVPTAEAMADAEAPPAEAAPEPTPAPQGLDEQLAAVEPPEPTPEPEPEPEPAPAAPEPTTVGPDMAKVAQPTQAPKQPGGNLILLDVLPEPTSAHADLYNGITLDAWAGQYLNQVMSYAKSQGLKGSDSGVWQLVEFGKGAGLYARVFQTCVDSGQVPPVLYVSSRSPLADTFLHVARASGKFTILAGTR